jgi:hypothetical protein
VSSYSFVAVFAARRLDSSVITEAYLTLFNFRYGSPTREALKADLTLERQTRAR